MMSLLQVYLNEIPTEKTNLLKLNAGPGNRDPAIFLEKDAPLPPVRVWTNVEMSQTLDPDSRDASFTYKIKVGDSVLFSKPNKRPTEFTDVEVLVPANSNSKFPAANALIRHLNIQGVEFNGE